MRNHPTEHARRRRQSDPQSDDLLRSSGSQALGRAISEAVYSANTNYSVRQAISAIAVVHGVDNVASIAIHLENGLRGGVYVATASGEPIGIYIDPDSADQELIVVHEIGHFIDHQALGKAKIHASAEDATLQDWRAAVSGTLAVQELQAILSRGTVRVVHNGVELEVPANLNDVTGDIRWTEIWARAYVHYVALRSGHAILTAQVTTRLVSQRTSPVRYTLWWEEPDFELVATAMDQVFSMKGWRT